MRTLLVSIAASLTCLSASAACPTGGLAGAATAPAPALLDCLRERDPELRDGVGFTALQNRMRSKDADPAFLHAVRGPLLARLATPNPDGYTQSFAALALAEVVRADRVKPYLSAAERKELVRAGTTYLKSVRDYRGFDAADGWRHGVAHGADLMLQMALNPALDKADHELILAAIASQVAPEGSHFYHYGEGERLMAPVFYLARRDTLDAAQWDAWFASLTTPVKGPVSDAALARSHNLKAFLYPLYASLAETQDAALRARLLPLATRALKQLN